MVCGCSVSMQTHGFGLWRSACSSCGDREVNMSAVPEGITSADVIVWGEGGTFAQQIAAGRHRLKGDEPDSVGALIPGHPHTTSCSPLWVPALDDGRDVCAKKEWPLERSRFGFDIRRYTLQTAQSVKREKACSTESSGTCDLRGLKRRTALAAARNCEQVPGAPHAHFGNQHPNETSMLRFLARESLGPRAPRRYRCHISGSKSA